MVGVEDGDHRMSIHLDAGASDIIISGIVLALLGFIGRAVWRFIKREIIRSETRDVTIPTPPDQPDRHVDFSGVQTPVYEAVAGLSETVTYLREENAALRHDRAGLIQHVTILRNGVDDGSIPPLPDLPEPLRNLFP